MDDHYDELETRPPESREGALMARLPGLVGRAQREAPGWARRLAGVDARAVCSRKALAALPVLRRDDLQALQQADPPFGGLVGTPPGRLGRLYMSPGPVFGSEGAGPDPWGVARALWAAGVRPGHVVQNCFGHQLDPGAWMLDGGARHLGAAVIPAGAAHTGRQIDLIRTLRPDAWCGTPGFLRHILERAQALGHDLPVVPRRVLLAGQTLPPSLRAWFGDRGIGTVLQAYGTDELGLVAYESSAMKGLILDEDLILEIVRPGTDEPVADGEVGEVVITRFGPDCPMIRFGTGDLSAVMAGISPCGRTNLRLRGWMGRADEATRVRGVFVHPAQVAEIARRHPEVLRARLVVRGDRADDAMMLVCEVADGTPAALAVRIVETVRDVTMLRAEVDLAAVGTLPDDGRVIEDARVYD